MICIKFNNFLNENKFYWTKEKCHEEALKYNTRSEFSNKSKSAYNVACKNGWLNEICSHMLSMYKSSYYWTKEKCKEEALKYNSRSEFQKNARGAYASAKINKWFDDICLHMKNGYVHWTYEKCKEESLKYKTRNQFSINSSSAYGASRKNGWLDDFFPKNK